MDLNEPLGMKPSPPRRPRKGLMIGTVLVAIVLGGVGLALVSGDPRASEPFAVAAIPPPAPVKAVAPAQGVDTIQTGSVSPSSPASEGQLEKGVRVVRSGHQLDPDAAAHATGPLIIDVTKALDANLHHAQSGTAALAPSDRSAKTTPPPRIALFVSGMGLSQVATKAAIESMPAAVTLAFLPYGETVAGQVAAAKAKGHEVLLQIPMQSGAGAAPGPHALHANEPETLVADDMSWLMGRFTGYDGVANLLGAAVTADAPVMTALLKAVHARNAFYLDDGTSKRSLGPTIAPGLDVPFARADVMLDATADAAVVAANLETLVAVAKRNGSAIGMASGLPDHLAEIARFANELGARGVVLVPVSALAAGRVSMALER